MSSTTFTTRLLTAALAAFLATGCAAEDPGTTKSSVNRIVTATPWSDTRVHAPPTAAAMAAAETRPDSSSVRHDIGPAANA